MSQLRTSYDALIEHAEAEPDRPFLHQPLDGEVRTWTRAAALDDARRFATALLALGLEQGDRVAILSKNCAEWVIADMAISLAGLISVPIYPTAGRDTITYVITHSEARAILIGRLDDPNVVTGTLPSDIMTIGMRYPSIDCAHSWQDLIDAAEPAANPPAPGAGDPMTILYTSGSTGKPKGVVISYGAYSYACQTTAEVITAVPEDRILSYLPLAHITERTCVVGPSIYEGLELFFTENLDTFLDDLRRARPTLFVSVPRLWVRFQSGVHEEISPTKLATLLRIPFVGKVVARKVRAGLGLDHVRKVGSGTAPISPDTLRWYEKLGIDIGEGWGMSETSGLSCTNSPFSSDRVGTIGAPIPGTEMKLSDEGEILIRSPGLMTEYYKQPELTAAAFDEDGYFRTGDKGEWNEKLGAFRIVGRVKEIFKSAKGKYVSPMPIEGKLAGNPMIGEVCVMGAGFRAPVAVVVSSVAARGKSKDAIKANLEATLNQVNTTLESHEKLSHIYVVEDVWSIENGLLTPTMKIKRDMLEKRYADIIKPEESERVIWADVA